MRGLIVILFLMLSVAVSAQDSTANNNITVKQDAELTALLADYKAYNAKRDTRDGYRIQITYTDIRDDVYKSKAGMYKQFPELASYVEYEQPYFKLRIGDFKTRLEAANYLQQVIVVYPGAFIVKDKIKIK